MNDCVACGETSEAVVCSCGCVTVARDRGDTSTSHGLGVGGTPVVESSLPENSGWGAEDLFFKDEAANPTGSVHDRAAARALSKLRGDFSEVELASTGDAAVSAAAFGARFDVDVEAYVPSRARFDVKSMVNVHGGEMTVVRGRYVDAVEALEDRDGAWRSTAPERMRGYADLVSEIMEDRSAVEPRQLVVPVGSGELLAGVLSMDPDAVVHGVQPAGCSPFADSVARGSYLACDEPDTVVGECEVSTPREALVATALEAADRGELELHTVDDGEALDACLSAARVDGVDLSPAGGVALAAAEGLSGTTVVVNPAAGRLSSDALRNRMVYHGE